MPIFATENFLLDLKHSLGQFSVAKGAEADVARLKAREFKGSILKFVCEKHANFCGTYHGKPYFFGSDLVQVTVFFWKIHTFTVS